MSGCSTTAESEPRCRAARLVLASASPRRRAMLADAGLIAEWAAPDLDDAALLPRRNTPRCWAMAMAWFKAVRVWSPEGSPVTGRIVLAADTVCELDGRIVGKPRDAAQCTALLEAFAGRTHPVHTGFCLLGVDRDTGRRWRWIGIDSADVEFGPLSRREIDRYVDSGEWRDKAGGYNFADRVRAGWPLRCDGDPATVMGLPMRRLGPVLRNLLAGSAAVPSAGSQAAGDRP